MTARKNTWKRSISFIYSTVSSLKERVGLMFFFSSLVLVPSLVQQVSNPEGAESIHTRLFRLLGVSVNYSTSISISKRADFIYLFISFRVYWSSAFLLDEAYWPIASRRKQPRLGIRGLNWSGRVNLRRRTFVPPWSEEGFFLLLISPWWGTGHPRVVLLPFPKPIHAKDLMGDLGD